MDGVDALMQSVDTLHKQYDGRYHMVTMRPEHLRVIAESMGYRGMLPDSLDRILGFRVVLDNNCPKETLIFHSPHRALVARIPWQGDLA